MGIKKTYFLLPAILVSGLLLYLPSLKYGFSQDDFIHLAASQINGFRDVFYFFNPYRHFQDIYFYRPLTTQFYFFMNRSFFGLTPLPFHIEALIVQMLNTILFYYLIKKIWHKWPVAILSTLLYAISSVHFLSLYYISSFQELGRTFFVFFALLCFILYEEKKSLSLYLFAIISFVLALLSKENSLIFPALLVVIEILRRRQHPIVQVVRTLLLPLLPFLVIAAGYVIIRFFGLQSIFSQGGYTYTIDPIIIVQNLKWYILWAFGLPEILSSYAASTLPEFIKDFPQSLIIICSLVIFVAGLTVLSLTIRTLSKKILLLSATVFVVGLSPMLFLAGHRYPQYLDIPFLVILPIAAVILIHKHIIGKIIATVAIGAFVVLQSLSLQLSEQTHWTTHRAQVASYYQTVLMKQYAAIPCNGIIVFTGTSDQLQQLSVTLAGNYALRLWYPQSNARVMYARQNIDMRLPQGTIVIPITRY